MSKMTIEYGNKVWRNEKGQIHREDGPAIIDAIGTQKWLVNGKIHRVDGPAVIRADRYQSWYINGIRITDRVKEWIKENGFPDYVLWTDTQKIMFRLAFSGTNKD